MVTGIEVDRESVEFVANFIKGKGFTDINITFGGDEFRHWDIEAVFCGKRYLIEVKHRAFALGFCYDNSVEEYKVMVIRDAIKKRQADAALLFSVYENGMRVSNMLESYEHDTIFAGAKTMYENQQKKEKHMAKFRHYKEYRYISEGMLSEGVDKNYNITLNTLL